MVTCLIEDGWWVFFSDLHLHDGGLVDKLILFGVLSYIEHFQILR